MLKENILAKLEQNRQIPLSGQKLAEEFHVSRNAVWKAINQLKSQGYEILSLRSSGYILAEDCHILSPEGIRSFLDVHADLPIFVFETIDSTNNEAKRMLSSGYEKTALIVSNGQTHGRGRRGRSFYSPDQTGIYMSFILPVSETCKNPLLLTLASSVAVLRSIHRLTDIELQIKWVNDLFYQGKKAGGILTEAISDLETGQISHAIAGIGINLQTIEFPEEFAHKAISLPCVNLNRNQLIASITEELLSMHWEDTDTFLDEYIRNSLVIGKQVVYRGEAVTALSILSDGGLQILHQDGQKEILYNGEIQLPD